MTIPILAVAWLASAALVSPAGAPFVWRLAARAQVPVIGAALVSLALIPGSLAMMTLATAVTDIGGGGFLERCGTLIAALVSQPLALPAVSLSLLMILAGVVGVAVGATRAWRSQASARRLTRISSGNGRVVVDCSDRFAFTAGLLKPRVVVSRGLLADTSVEWQSVVLAHEEAHRRGRHPLLVFAAETLAQGLPLLPLRWASDLLRLSLEAVADERASDAVSDKALVAEAISSAALSPALAGSIGFEGHEVARVRRLLHAPAQIPTIVAAVMVVAALAAAGFAGAHALHCGDTALHSLGVTQCRFTP